MTLTSKAEKPLIGAEVTCKLMVSKMDEQRNLYIKTLMRNKTSNNSLDLSVESSNQIIVP
jgi:hypothetical protein